MIGPVKGCSQLLIELERKLKELGVEGIQGEFIPQENMNPKDLKEFYEESNYKINNGYVEKSI